MATAVRTMFAALTTVFAVGAADAAGTVADTQSHNGYEIPAYQVLQQAGAIELRRYAPRLAAEVTVSGDQNTAARRGFRMLANFIFGGNQAAESVSMTAPVTQSQSSKIAMTAPVTQVQTGDTWTVRFMMPSEYTQQTLPRPNDARITIVTLPPQTRLVVRFNGTTNANMVRRRAAQLEAYAKTHGLTLDGPYELARYDDPFTLPWKRRNEVSFATR